MSAVVGGGANPKPSSRTVLCCSFSVPERSRTVGASVSGVAGGSTRLGFPG